MAKVVIYYKLNQTDLLEQVVFHVDKLIEQLESLHTIKGVFLDNYNESTELMELLNSPLSEIDFIYINKFIKDEFNNELISQLSRAEKFKIEYFD